MSANGYDRVHVYVYGTALSEADGQRLVTALRRAGDPSSRAAAEAISRGVDGLSIAVPLSPEMQAAVRSVLENSQSAEHLDVLRQKLARTSVVASKQLTIPSTSATYNRPW